MGVEIGAEVGVDAVVEVEVEVEGCGHCSWKISNIFKICP